MCIVSNKYRIHQTLCNTTLCWRGVYAASHNKHNKPWITSDLKVLLDKKKKAFRSGDREELSAQHNLSVKLRECKDSYRRKLEAKLLQNNARDVWTRMK